MNDFIPYVNLVFAEQIFILLVSVLKLLLKNGDFKLQRGFLFIMAFPFLTCFFCFPGPMQITGKGMLARLYSKQFFKAI